MEICYLLAFPDLDVSPSRPAEQIKGLKDAPYFQPIDIDLVTLGEETVLVEGYAIAVLRQRYDGRVQMVEARYDLPDPFAASVLPDRTKNQSTLRSRYIPENFRGNGLFEEFSFLLMQDAKPAPDKWIEKMAWPWPTSSAPSVRCSTKRKSARSLPHVHVTLPVS